MAAKRDLELYNCTECGWRSAKWVGQCGECQQWGTVTDAPRSRLGTKAGAVVAPTQAHIARPITEFTTAESERYPSGISEFDRVLGGGFVPGAAILLSGEPGVGKSTLLLEVAARTARAGRRVLYVSAEESTAQVRLRAERTGALHDELYLASENDLGVILGQVEAARPEMIILDSVQTVASAELDGAPGHPAQVKEVSAALIRLAKTKNIPVILVGHVTKDGSVAGPRLLEHLVDVVCHFSGDRHTSLRFLRAIKNRFGPSDELGCFDMHDSGIAEVPDPASLFIGSGAPVAGTCVAIAMEGKRVLPVEVQALAVPSAAPNPRRVVSGVDGARVAMILAVLERRGGITTSGHDVYVSTVGGVKLTEPAADLAIALAIVGAIKDRALSSETAAVGELSLSGEIRAVNNAKSRAQEARRLGYRRLVDRESSTINQAMRQAWS